MIVRYFDSSVVLSLLLNDKHEDRALAIWSEEAIRVSSRLLAFESAVVVRRYAAAVPSVQRPDWISESFTWLEKAYRSIVTHEIDTAVLGKLVSLDRLSQSRTLDGIHIATAFIFADASDNFELVSFDTRMQNQASEVALQIIQ